METVVELCPFCGNEPYIIADILSGEPSAAMCIKDKECPLNNIYIDISAWQSRPIETALYKRIDELKNLLTRGYVIVNTQQLQINNSSEEFNNKR